MKIIDTEIVVLSDPPPEKAEHTEGIGPLAVLRIRTDEGITGTSEIFSVPPGVAKAVLDGPDSLFGRILIGQDPVHPEHLRDRLYNSMIHGNRRGWAVICIGAADVALWDIYGKAMGRPVYELLGGAERNDYQVHSESQRREAIPYCTIVPDSYDGERMISDQLRRIEHLLELGFRAFKVEPMMSPPAAVVECARQARALIGSELMLAVDVGYGLNDVPTARWICDRLADHDVLFFETPFPVDHIDAYAALAQVSPVSIAMGEHAVTRWEFLQMMDHGGVKVVQPYPVTVGGLTEAKRVVDLAHPARCVRHTWQLVNAHTDGGHSPPVCVLTHHAFLRVRAPAGILVSTAPRIDGARSSSRKRRGTVSVGTRYGIPLTRRFG